MFENFNKILQSNMFSIIERIDLPSRSARYKEIPAFLFKSAVGKWLQKKVHGECLWTHQSLAIEEIESGKNVVLSTGTASGKSLVFQSIALHKVLSKQDERILVFYPLKALAADQLRSWRTALEALSLPTDTIGLIDGSIPLRDRESILNSARIILMTPDVCHAWLMSSLANPVIRVFMQHLSLIILDEAHTLEGVFGSNFSLLFRRLQVVRNILNKKQSLQKKFFEVIAATATIANPIEHLKKLTGLDFVCIGDEEDGSPKFERCLVHIACPPKDALSIATKFHIELLRERKKGGFITFIDSRKMVETLAYESNKNEKKVTDLCDESNKELSTLSIGAKVLPYRSGFLRGDRQEIERRLQEGELPGVVCTSALELGIDIPHLTVGLNLGVPATRKSFLQRLGRIGRTGPGGFIVLAESNAFRQYGTTFEDYYKASVEPCYLYLDNRFIQFAQALCLVNELDTSGERRKLMRPVPHYWPDGFDKVFEAACPENMRPKEFDTIVMMCGSQPQRGSPLRNIGETRFKIIIGSDFKDDVGEINLAQAIRECYPGATYYHFNRLYKVLEWKTTNQIAPCIEVKPVRFAKYTKPRIRTWINIGLNQTDIIDDHLKKGDFGFIAECQMQITERVEGYQEGSAPYQSYRERQRHNPKIHSFNRYFRTTGIILCVEQNWFRTGNIKQFIADRFREIFCREYSILPQDIGSAATNISTASPHGNTRRSDCVVFFDNTYGSLRLTERFYSRFEILLERLSFALNTTADEEHKPYLDVVDNFREFLSTLSETKLPEVLLPPPRKGMLRVFTEDSIVGFKKAEGLFTEVQIIEPAFLPDGSFAYRVKCFPKHKIVNGKVILQDGGRKWVKAELLEPLADSNFAYAFWDSETEEYIIEEDEQEESEKDQKEESMEEE